MIERREFLARLAGTTAGSSALLSAGPAFAGLGDLLMWQNVTAPADNDVLDTVATIASNARSMMQGMYHGWGLAVHELLKEEQADLPTIPPRNHAAWPHLHCLCHCVAVTNIGDDGMRWSVWGGIRDETMQGMFANLYRRVIHSRILNDIAYRAGDDPSSRGVRMEFRMVLNYLFGDKKRQRKALTLASFKSKKRKRKLIDLKEMLAPIVDACESAWQRADFVDNAIGRAGGCQCPKSLKGYDRVVWCKKWCSSKGVPTNTPEGPRTARPWGPYHPTHPGPVPTYHETLFGDLVKPTSLFDEPHPAFVAPAPLEHPAAPNGGEHVAG